MQKVIQIMLLVVATLLVMNGVMAQPDAPTNGTLPSSVLQQITLKLDAIQIQQNTLINSLADLKVKQHEDFNMMVTKENFGEFREEINTRVDRKPEIPVIVLTSFITSGIWLGVALMLKAGGKL